MISSLAPDFRIMRTAHDSSEAQEIHLKLYLGKIGTAVIPRDLLCEAKALAISWHIEVTYSTFEES